MARGADRGGAYELHLVGLELISHADGLTFI